MRNIKIYDEDSYFDFGKHKYETIESVISNDPSYIVWCINNVDSFSLSLCAIIELDKKIGVSKKLYEKNNNKTDIYHEDDKSIEYYDYDDFYPDEYMAWSDGWSKEDMESGLAEALDCEIEAYWNID